MQHTAEDTHRDWHRQRLAEDVLTDRAPGPTAEARQLPPAPLTDETPSMAARERESERESEQESDRQGKREDGMDASAHAPVLGRVHDTMAGWFGAYTFVPDWLPERWRHPLAGYAVAALMQVAASLMTLRLPHLVPTFSLAGLLELLVVALIAVSWGVGPSIFAALLGAALLEWLVLPLGFGQHFAHPDDLIEVGWFLLVGLALGAVIGQTERARRRAIHERAEAYGRELGLREVSQRTDEFLSLASHELRSPLTGIKTALQLTRRRLRRLTGQGMVTHEQLAAQTASLIEVLARAEEQVDRQNRLIGDFLDVSRIRANKLEFRFAPVELDVVVLDIVEEQRLAWPERTILLSTPAQPVAVTSDPDRIAQVVTNYLSNALKYSASDCPVSVVLRCEGSVAQVLVRDQGAGLSPEQQRHIWERFHRVPGIKQQSGSGAGLGLGLYIVRSIVTRHGGEVGVESAPSLGSTFWFTIPLRAIGQIEP
jgi:signal transduction histidine kinase